MRQWGWCLAALGPSRACNDIHRWLRGGGPKAFVTLAKTVRKHLEGILAPARLGVNNARHGA